MDGQTIVVPARGCILPQLSGCSPASYPSSPRRSCSLEQSLAKSFGNGASERQFVGRAGGRDCRRSCKTDSPQVMRVGSVTCYYGKSNEGMQRREDFGLDSERFTDRPLASADGRQGIGDPYSSRDDSLERYRGYVNGQAGEARGYRIEHRSSGRSPADDSSWQGNEKFSYTMGKGPQSAADSRTSDGRNVQCIEEDGEDTTEERMPDRNTTSLDHRNDSGRVDIRNPIARQPILNIPRSELMKIEELRFSGDLREGDSGPQVLNLQRALFWLGHLPGLSLTGYFGQETTRALQEFHTAHGVPSSGVWSFHSQQALRKHLHPESYRLEHVEKPVVKESVRSQQRIKSSRSLVAEIKPLAKDFSGKVVRNGQHARQVIQLWYSKALPEFIASVSAVPQLTWVSGRVGGILLGIVVLSGFAKIWLTLFRKPEGQPVRRRVMSWRNDVNLRDPTRIALRAHVSQAPLNSSDNEGFMRRPRSRLGPTPIDQQEDNHNLLDRLVLFDGQVLRADSPNNGKTLPVMGSGLDVLAQNSVDETSRSSMWNQTSQWSSTEQPYHGRLNVEQEKTVYGFDPHVKQEADPPRKYQSLLQNDSASRLTGREPYRPVRDNSYHPPHPGWSAWMGSFVSTMFPDKERHSSQKPLSRRYVRRSTSPGRTKSAEKVLSKGRPALRFNTVERGLMDDNDGGKWQEVDESDLKRRVEELHRTVQAADQTRVAAMRALAEERMRSLELEVKISRQKEAAASLEEEVRVLKESHDALLASLRKKYSSSAAARAAAALLYQNWDSSDSSARV